jgi:GNAT superfamily N-acetyltransferase
MDQVEVRKAVRDDLPAFRDIEWASGQRYRQYGLDLVADEEAASVEVLAECADDGRSWVPVVDARRPIGCILVDLIEGGGHIEQVSVEPTHQGEGVGRALIEPAKSWARSRGLSALTLTTF